MEKSAGIGGAPIWAMHLIAKEPGIGVTQLAQAMDVHQSTASNLVKSLVQAGFIHTEKAAHDKQALSELDDQTLEELERSLEVLLQRMDIDESSAKTPMAMM